MSPWLGLCHNISTPARIPRLHLPMVNSLHNSIHALKNGDKFSEDGAWLPMEWGNKKRSQMQSSEPMDCISQCTIAYICIPGDQSSVQLGNATIVNSVQHTYNYANMASSFKEVCIPFLPLQSYMTTSENV